MYFLMHSSLSDLARRLKPFIRQHLHDVLGPEFCAAHLQVQHDVLVAIGEAAQQANRHVPILHLGADTAELGADAENFIAMMHHIAAFRHLHAEQLSLQEDPSRLLRSAVESLQPCPCNPYLLAVIN